MSKYVIQHYELKLEFKAPFLSQAAGTLAFGKDVAMQRYQDKPALNGSLVRGNIRGALESFVDVIGADQSHAKNISKFVTTWFGKRPKGRDGNVTLTNERSRINFDLFWVLDEKQSVAENQRTRIKLDSELGKIEKGALQVIEDCFPVGSERVKFTGRLSVKFDQETKSVKEQKVDFVRYVNLALESIPAMGSLKGIGFGQLEAFSLKAVDAIPTIKSNRLQGNESRFAFNFTLDRPFCLGKPRTPDSNRLVSDVVITGNVLKGVIASQFVGEKGWQDDLCFDQLSFSHAVPNGTCSALPLSLAIVEYAKGDVGLVDFATLDDPMTQDWGSLCRAPIFQPDWKAEHYKWANKEFGVVTRSPSRMLLVKTGINHAQGVSEESQLFSIECVEPQGFVWSGEVDLSAVPEKKREKVTKQLVALFEGGLNSIGKTNAALKDVELSPLLSLCDASQFAEINVGERVIVTLTTDARLMQQGFERREETVSARDLYESYWQTASKGALSLVDFYAQQYREGGQWHYKRFQNSQTYHPEWLTKAGSVFVLQLDREDGAAILRQWQQRGLVAAQNSNGEAPAWENTPYLAEHGFGRVKINCPIQASFVLNKEVS